MDMKDERITNAYDSISPSDDAKERMLANIMARAEAEGLLEPEGYTAQRGGASPEPAPARKRRPWRVVAGIAAAAACLVLAIGIGVPMMNGTGSFSAKDAAREAVEDVSGEAPSKATDSAVDEETDAEAPSQAVPSESDENANADAPSQEPTDVSATEESGEVASDVPRENAAGLQERDTTVEALIIETAKRIIMPVIVWEASLG